MGKLYLIVNEDQLSYLTKENTGLDLICSGFLKWHIPYHIEEKGLILNPSPNQKYMFTQFYEVKKWIEENCEGNVFVAHINTTKIRSTSESRPDFIFELDKDAMLFKLTWC